MDNSKKSKKYIFKRIVKFGLFFIIFFSLNYFFSNLFIKKKLYNSRAYKVDVQCHKAENKTEIIALGDSHAATGFDPRVFKNGFNFSSFGENYIYNYYKLKYILEKNNKLKTVILPIDLHTFSTWRADRFWHDFYWIRYVNYLELGSEKKMPLRFIGKYISAKLFPYLGEFKTIFNFTPSKKRKARVKPMVFQGFVIKKNDFFYKRGKRTKQRIGLHYYKQKSFDKTVKKYFKKILQICLKHNIKLILVKYPVSKIYYEYAAKIVKVENYYNKITFMIKKYRNVQILDFHNLFFRNDGIFFHDPDHLNQRGAKEFSVKVREELKRLKIY